MKKDKRTHTLLTVLPDSLLAVNLELVGVYKGSVEPLLPPGLVSAFLLTAFFTLGGVVEDVLKLKFTLGGCAKYDVDNRLWT